jgi:hypothetical protein
MCGIDFHKKVSFLDCRKLKNKVNYSRLFFYLFWGGGVEFPTRRGSGVKSPKSNSLEAEPWDLGLGHTSPWHIGKNHTIAPARANPVALPSTLANYLDALYTHAKLSTKILFKTYNCGSSLIAPQPTQYSVLIGWARSQNKVLTVGCGSTSNSASKYLKLIVNCKFS